MSNALGPPSQQTSLFQNAVNVNTNSAILEMLQQINARIDGIEHTVNGLQREMALQPMRTANAAASFSAPLLYPPGTTEANLTRLPRTKADAFSITEVDEASQALELLGVPQVQGANADEVTSQLFQFLGI